MNVRTNNRQALASTLFVTALVVLALILGIVQYRWIGEVSRAERERLRGSVQVSLQRLSQDFNAEINRASEAILPGPFEADADEAYVSRYQQWRDSARHPALFRTVAIATPSRTSVTLKTWNAATGTFVAAQWPDSWAGLREAIEQRLAGAHVNREVLPLIIELPRFAPPRPGMRERQELDWLILEVDPVYLRERLIPQLLERFLGASGDFLAEIVVAGDPSQVLFRNAATPIGASADASVRLFDPRPEFGFRRGRFPGGPGGRGGGPPPDFFPSDRRRPPAFFPPDRGRGPESMAADRGRWILNIRHRAGSLEAVVQKNRWRNLGITGAILLLLVAAVAALVRYTRRAQTLADLQMQFVAGVSHELRTPLTVMRTAGHNLRQSRVASDPARVERYGELIEEQSGKLTGIVEQVLRFANTRAGRVIGAKEPLSIEAVIDDAIEAGRRTLDAQRCTVATDIAPDMPPVDGDRTSLQHALHNFIDNAAKYGQAGECIAISAHAVNGQQPRMIEIRIRDRGRGIPKDELPYIFDPFYRGKSAVEDQVHGTGLGLDLARRIIEAHKGTVNIESEEGKGTEVLVRLPAAT